MTAEEIREVWRDPKSWRLGMFYYAKADPRIFVQKRLPGFGWTLNFARRASIPALIALILPVVAVAAAVKCLGMSREISAIPAGFCLVWTLAVILICIYFSSPERAAGKRRG
jgi:hypothetical protein